MSRTLTVQLSEEVYAALGRRAEATGTSPAELAAASLESQFHSCSPCQEGQRQAARERFERRFGAVDLGYPTGADNESIDADLAKGYADAHERADALDTSGAGEAHP
jgi:hypothetical protein